MGCKYYDKATCGVHCKDDWVKCDICKKYLDWVGDLEEINGYEIMSASISCDDSERYDIIIRICPDCLKIIKEMKK